MESCTYLSIRTDWTKEEIADIFFMPLLKKMVFASEIHQKYHNPEKIDRCTLLSVKTGKCPQDCAYCPQSMHYATNIESHDLLDKEVVYQAAQKAVSLKSTYFCLGQSGKHVKNDKDFEKLLAIIESLKKLPIKICCTLGMLTEELAIKLKNAGVYAYNHNIDAGPNFYKKIITTRSFEDRIKTLQILEKVGLQVCSGGIIGMGENKQDRIDFIHQLATLTKHPFSIPINALLPIKGTPLEGQKPTSIWELLHMITTLRMVMPKSIIRLAAGRGYFSHSEQALCFLVGAGSIHTGEKLLTVSDCSIKDDLDLFSVLGIDR